jgi:hypothetical protein
MSDVREIKIVGAKQSDLVMKRRRTRKRQEGGDLDEEEPIAQPKGPIKVSKVNEVATPPIATNSAQQQTALAPAPAPAPAPTPAPAPIPASTQQGGEAKVVLKSKVAKQTKVLLKKKEPVASGPVPQTKPLKVKTRKVVVQAITKKLNKTRHAMKQAKELPIEQVRAVLIDKKLIKSTSKAPDSILRQIYSDSLIVAKKTL